MDLNEIKDGKVFQAANLIRNVAKIKKQQKFQKRRLEF